MNNTQRAKLDAGNRVIDFNKKHETELSSIPEYAQERYMLGVSMAVINTAAQAQTVESGIQVNTVDLAKQHMVNLIVKYALRAVVKARQDGNLVLANKLDHPVTYLSKANKTLAVHRSKEIRDNLNDNLSTLNNVTTENVAEIDAAIASYDQIKDSPTIDRQTKTATGTNPLPAAFATATQAIDNMYNLVVSYFMGTNRPLVDELALAKHIIKTGTHHNRLEGKITENSFPVVGASIAVSGTSKSATSNIDGHYSIVQIKTGDQTLVVTLPNGSSTTQIAHIIQATINTLDFKL